MLKALPRGGGGAELISPLTKKIEPLQQERRQKKTEKRRREKQE